jgi:hypothetical protein
MIRKYALAGVLALASLAATGCGEAGLRVRIGPPAPIVESYGAAPGPGYVWQPGYQRWDGRAYVWAPGRWAQPPRGRRRWEPGRWQQRRGNWVYVEGRWR